MSLALLRKLSSVLPPTLDERQARRIVKKLLKLHDLIEDLKYIRETEPYKVFLPSPKQEIALNTDKRFTFLAGARPTLYGKAWII